LHTPAYITHAEPQTSDHLSLYQHSLPPVLDTGTWAGTNFYIPYLIPLSMKITLVNCLFLFIFALAASSTPVPPVHDHTLRAPSTRVKSPSGVIYTIDGNHYTEKDIQDAVNLINMADDGKMSPSPEDIAKAEILVIEAMRLDITDELRLGTNYHDIQFTLHFYMLTLIDSLLPDIRRSNDETVISLARNALRTCLNWEAEKKYTYNDIHPGSPSLYDLGYLHALEVKLESLRPGNTDVSTPDGGGIANGTQPQQISGGRKRGASASTPDGGIPNDTQPQQVSGGKKRRASAISSSDGDGNDNGRLRKMRRRSRHWVYHHEHMTG
ncbi:hypothetical protein H0H93_009583, partial [Arthromyces matolae]